ncbi:SMI1/KNR4 family protein [Pseudomonas promysalinigenes]
MITLNDIIQVIENTFADCKICFDHNDVPADLCLPKSWERFGLNLESSPVYPQSWNSFSNEFPSVISLFNGSLLGTVLMLGASVKLVYVFHDANGLYYYVGGMPVEAYTADNVNFNGLPARLQEFYRDVHDGYTFFPARSMGPQSLGDQSRVSDLVDEDDDSFAKQWITVFSNGAGDYVAVDAAKRGDTEGLIWWHEHPMVPELDVDVFEVMNAWMAIFLEDTKPRDEIIAKLH